MYWIVSDQQSRTILKHLWAPFYTIPIHFELPAYAVCFLCSLALLKYSYSISGWLPVSSWCYDFFSQPIAEKIKSLERYFFAFLLWNFFKNGMERERAWEWKLSFYIKRQTQYRKYESYDLNERCSDFRSDAIVIPITKMRCFCMRNETIA